MGLIQLGILASNAGCDPSGAADCLAAINAAGVKLTGTGGVLYFGAGTYKVSAAITWPANVGIEIGQGVTFTGAGAASVTALATGHPAGPGTSGQFLKSNGPGALPTWAAGGSQGPSFFSIIDFAKSVSAVGIDVYGNHVGADNTMGGCFTVTDGLSTHVLTGARTYYLGHATNLKASVWRLGSGGYVLLGATTTAVGAAPGDITLPVGPFTLVAGEAYLMGVYDTAVTQQTTWIGNAAGPMGEMFANKSSFDGSSWWKYVIPSTNGGGGLQSPFALYANGDAVPSNITGTNFITVEPVLTY